MRKIKDQLNLRSTRGSVSVELAILLIPLIVMIFGVAEFGRAIYQYNTLAKAARDSVRLLSQHNPNNLESYTDVEAEARCLAVYGSIENCGNDEAKLLKDLTMDMVQISSTTGPGGINLVEARITGYSFNFMFNPLAFLGDDYPSTITFGDIHATMRQL